jgi:hypothetical protein
MEFLPPSDDIPALPVGSELDLELNFGDRIFIPHPGYQTDDQSGLTINETKQYEDQNTVSEGA